MKVLLKLVFRFEKQINEEKLVNQEVVKTTANLATDKLDTRGGKTKASTPKASGVGPNLLGQSEENLQGGKQKVNWNVNMLDSVSLQAAKNS